MLKRAPKILLLTNVPGQFRALVEKGHKVSVFTTDSCPEQVSKYMPGAVEVHESTVMPDIVVPLNPLEALISLRNYLHESGIINAYEEIDRFIDNSPHKYDLVIGDTLVGGTILAARKHGIPIVNVFTAPLLETARTRPSVWDRNQLPIEEPGVSLQTRKTSQITDPEQDFTNNGSC